MITTAKRAHWIVVDRHGRSLEDDAASVYDRVHPQYLEFFALHLRHAFAGTEVECIVGSRDDNTAPMRFWTMRPIVDFEEIVSVELTCSDLLPGDEEEFPGGTSLSEKDLRAPIHGDRWTTGVREAFHDSPFPR